MSGIQVPVLSDGGARIPTRHSIVGGERHQTQDPPKKVERLRPNPRQSVTGTGVLPSNPNVWE